MYLIEGNDYDSGNFPLINYLSIRKTTSNLTMQ